MQDGRVIQHFKTDVVETGYFVQVRTDDLTTVTETF